MPRIPLIRTNSHPYHVTIRCNNREWFDLPLKQVWEICLSSLKKSYAKFPVKVHVFLLMGNHYHLLLTTPESNLDLFMGRFNSELSKRIRGITGRINRVFGGRYKWSLIKDDRHFRNVLKYIYLNPVRAKIVGHPENYPFSSLFYLKRKWTFIIPLHDTYFGEFDKFLEWINQFYRQEENVALKQALRKNEFKIPLQRSSRRKICDF